MLLVKTYLDKSPIHGIGLFAGEFIPKDTKIYEIDRLLTMIYSDNFAETIKWQSPLVQEFYNRYSWKNRGRIYLSLDNDRFMNESDSPNVYETDQATFASRDINQGEEITTNYAQLEQQI